MLPRRDDKVARSYGKKKGSETKKMSPSMLCAHEGSKVKKARVTRAPALPPTIYRAGHVLHLAVSDGVLGTSAAQPVVSVLERRDLCLCAAPLAREAAQRLYSETSWSATSATAKPIPSRHAIAETRGSIAAETLPGRWHTHRGNGH